MLIYTPAQNLWKQQYFDTKLLSPFAYQWMYVFKAPDFITLDSLLVVVS